MKIQMNASVRLVVMYLLMTAILALMSLHSGCQRARKGTSPTRRARAAAAVFAAEAPALPQSS